MTAGNPDFPLLGRLVRPADYVRVLATPPRLRSPHFAVHHMEGRPLPLKVPKSSKSRAPDIASLSTELSTGSIDAVEQVVEDLRPQASGRTAHWLGFVVPKRHAKRAVTRTLVKRQIRHIAAACAPELAPGLWVVRQRSPFDPKQFLSAASEVLKDTARAELLALFERAVRGEHDRLKPRDPNMTTKRRSNKGRSQVPAPSDAAFPMLPDLPSRAP